jgi:hypothetical protein
MESKVILLDPTSHTSSRSFFTIPVGAKYFTRKLRLLNFRVLNPQGRPIYFGLNGIYSLVKNITVANMQGTVIDQMGGACVDMMGFRNIHTENATSQYLGRQLSQNLCVSVSCPTESQLCLTETQGKDSASQIWAHLDISSMLNYLQVRAVANEGLQITIEWNEQLSPVNGGYYFSVPPCLAYDEVLGNVPVDKSESFIYTSIIQNRLNIPVQTGAGPYSAQLDTRLNSYINCYIKNIYYFNANQQIAVANNPAGYFNRATYMPFAVQNERLEISIDGKWLMTNKGLNTDARKLASASDWSGEFCIPSAPSYYYGVESLNGEPYGLVNQNLDLIMNGNVSYGALAINQFVKDNFQIVYSGTLGHDNGQPAVQQLIFLAETLRTYSSKTGTVSNVFAPMA